MATHTKKAAKPSKSAKPVSGAKKTAHVGKTLANKKTPVKTIAKKAAAPAKKVVPAKKAAIPAKKVTPAKKTTKPAVKAAPAKKASTPVKKVAVKPQPKKAPAKKADINKKPAKINNQKTVNKKNSKPVAPAKKAIPVKKTVTTAKPAPAKKSAPPAKKATATKPVVKPIAKAAAKPATKSTAKPVAKAAPAKTTPPAKKSAPPAAPPPVSHAKKVPVKKKLTITQMPVKINPSTPRPMATPAARSIDKKPTVIIAHRRMESKLKAPKDAENTMITYQPETYRSILDEPQQQQGPVYRYSDEDLAEFREIITSRLEAARKELNYLQGLITRKDEAGTEDTENRYMNMEDGSGAMEREQLAQLASRQIQFMSHLEKALVRIENKTYGICRVTGKLIDKARLRAVPHATLSIEAKKLMATKQN
jgi:RNA polymerase-binding transcription factor DksA